MSFIIAGTAIAGAGAAYNIIDGANKEADGKRLGANNKRPWYTIPDQYGQNVNLATQQAETGLSPSTLNYYTTQTSRGLGSGISAMLEGGGDVDNLSRLYDQFSQGLSQEAAEDNNLKTQHLGTLINANKDLAGQETQQWALNYYDPYKDTAQLASAEKTGGKQEIGTGIGEAVGAAASASNQSLYADRTAKMTPPDGGVPLTSSTPKVNIPAFGTPGGSAVIDRLGKTDALSPQLQQLIAMFKNQPQTAD